MLPFFANIQNNVFGEKKITCPCHEYFFLRLWFKQSSACCNCSLPVTPIPIQCAILLIRFSWGGTRRFIHFFCRGSLTWNLAKVFLHTTANSFWKSLCCYFMSLISMHVGQLALCFNMKEGKSIAKASDGFVSVMQFLLVCLHHDWNPDEAAQ